jgi:hypothetical protein
MQIGKHSNFQSAAKNSKKKSTQVVAKLHKKKNCNKSWNKIFQEKKIVTDQFLNRLTSVDLTLV